MVKKREPLRKKNKSVKTWLKFLPFVQTSSKTKLILKKNVKNFRKSQVKSSKSQVMTWIFNDLTWLFPKKITFRASLTQIREQTERGRLIGAVRLAIKNRTEKGVFLQRFGKRFSLTNEKRYGFWIRYRDFLSPNRGNSRSTKR